MTKSDKKTRRQKSKNYENNYSKLATRESENKI